MKSRISECFSRLKAQGRKALVPYLTAGDPNKDTSLALMHALVECGADIIELGVPFTDPSADGPVIQRASERALLNNTSLADVLDIVQKFRQENSTTPVVLMGYLNPIESMAYEPFAIKANEAGMDGVLIVDMPPEESTQLRACLQARSIDTIFLVAPTTSETRAKTIVKHCSGYLYYVSLKGITGAGHLDVKAVADKLESISALTDLPILVGFGIRDADTARQIAQISSGVIVGSALVSKIAEFEPAKVYSQRQLLHKISLIKDMREAIDLD